MALNVAVWPRPETRPIALGVPVDTRTDYASELLSRLLPLRGREASLVGRIAEWVGRAIIEGQLEPGADLNTVELSRRFETSRTPVREALMLLEKEGLVEIPPRRRPRVARISRDEIREVYILRATLNGLMAELIASSATDEEIASLRARFQEMDHAADRHDLQAYFWANVAFYERMTEICGNRYVRRVHNTLGLRTLMLRHRSMTLPNRAEASRSDHRQMMQAIEERDGRLASAVSQAIIMRALRALEQAGE